MRWASRGRLEGGYDLDALAHGADAVCRLLLGEEPRTIRSARRPTSCQLADVEPLLDAIRELHGLTDGSNSGPRVSRESPAWEGPTWQRAAQTAVAAGSAV